MSHMKTLARHGVSPLALLLALAPVTAALADDDTLFVTARVRPVSEADLAAPFSVVSRDAIKDTSAGSLGSVLASQPGIAESSFASGASRPIVRGLDNFRVRIQENSVGAADASALSEDHGPAIDPLAAERIEVVRGPATLRYGSEAIGGVVQVLNDRLPKRLPDRPFSGEVFASASSVTEGFEGGGQADLALGNIVAHGDVFARNFGDYSIPGGRQARTAVESLGFAGGLGFVTDAGHLSGAVSRFTSEYDIPAADDPLFIDLEQTRYNVSAGRSLEGWLKRLAFDGGYSDYTHDEIDEATGDIGSTFNNEEWEARIEALHGALLGAEGAFGLQYRARDLSAAGEGGELIAPAETRAIAGFLFEEFALTPGARLEFGARIEHVEIEGTGFRPVLPDGEEFAASRDFTPLGASLGLVFDLPAETLLGLTVYGVQRAPDALELFSKGPHEATETFEIGDPDLDTETAYSLEATLKRDTQRFGFALSAYYTQYQDFIFKAFTGVQCGDEFNTCGVETELDQIVFSQEDASFFGVEAEARVRVLSWGEGHFDVGALFDFVEAELDASGNVPRIPPMRYGISFAAEHGPAFAEASFRRADEQTDIAAFETETKGYELLNASAGVVLPLGGDERRVRVALVGTNLLDADIRNHVSFKKEDVLQPGRGVRLVVSAAF